MCNVEIDHANHYHDGAQVKIEVIITPRSSTELKGKLREVGRGDVKNKGYVTIQVEKTHMDEPLEKTRRERTLESIQVHDTCG